MNKKQEIIRSREKGSKVFLNILKSFPYFHICQMISIFRVLKALLQATNQRNMELGFLDDQKYLLDSLFYLGQQMKIKERVCNNMSFIIDQTDNFLLPFRKTAVPHSNIPPTTGYETEKTKLEHCEEILKLFENEDNQILTSQQDSHSHSFTYLLSEGHRKRSAIVTLKINLKTERIILKSQLLNKHNKYFRIEGRDRVTLMGKYLNIRYNLQHQYNEFNLVIDPRNGAVSLKIPTFYFMSHLTSKKYLPKFLKSIKYDLASSLEEVYNALQMVSEQKNQKINTSAVNHHNRQRFNKLQPYFNVMNIFLYICSESTHEEQFLKSQLQKENDSIKRLSKHYIPFQKEFTSLFLYEYCQEDHCSNENLQLQLTKEDKGKIKEKIELPQMQKSKNPNQNCYILNYIKTKNKVNKSLIKKVCSGGFTSIYLADIEFWYVASYNIGVTDELTVSPTPSSQECHRKYLIIKREDKKMLEEGQKSRISHERFILTRIKNGISIFLNKYYLLAQKDNNFQKDLLSDYIDYPTLYDYCQKNKETMSFQTKIYLSIMIAQSLRYLSEYKIAHLDLKPTNIMTNRKLTIKLIDFGESYHPELKNHQPGFSIPYSAPENYILPETYNYKNDVFSLGVIMHEMFLGKYPFYFYDEKFRDKVYRKKNFYDYWFQSPEGNSFSGQSVVFPLLEAIIMKCLHADPERRPELEWIAYLLRGCIDYFY